MTLGLTRDDIDSYGASIFEHFWGRGDGNAIRIDGVTYTGAPARALAFDDCARLLLDDVNSDNLTKTRKHLLVCLLNIAANRLDQRSVVSTDGATASQAISYFSSRYLAADATDWSAWYNLMNIECTVMIAAGVIPLSTPNVMYKPAEGDQLVSAPESYILSQNFPNPFNPSTTISYAIPNESKVTVEVFDVLGRKVKTLVDEEQPAGSYHVVWDGENSQGQEVGTGIYFYRLTAGDVNRTKKMVLLK
jgi:hypothetical protein